MTIRDKQILFGQLFPLLIIHAQQLGFQVVIGQVWRSSKESRQMVADGKGIHPSLHEHCLAGHLELFDDDEYVTSTDTHRPLGEWWEKQHELCRWGGRFGDGNHYSIAHGGMA